MKPFYKKAVVFWFVLLVLALLNATLRETTYKPLLSPYIGMWAHQISSLTALVLFFVAIYYFLKRSAEEYSTKDLGMVGALWFGMTVLFETGMNVFVRNLTLHEVLQTYYFWRGETWIFVLLSLVVSPLLADKLLNRRNE